MLHFWESGVNLCTQDYAHICHGLRHLACVWSPINTGRRNPLTT